MMSYPGGLHSPGLSPLLFLEIIYLLLCCNATGLCFLMDSTFSLHSSLLTPLPPLSPSLTFLSSLELLLMPTMLLHAPPPPPLRCHCWSFSLQFKLTLSSLPLSKLHVITAILVLNVHGENKLGVKKKKQSTGFSSAGKTYRAHAHAAIAWLRRLIVNTVAGCYFHGQALGLNADIPTCFCAIFRLRKHTNVPEVLKVKDSPWWLPEL